MWIINAAICKNVHVILCIISEIKNFLIIFFSSVSLSWVIAAHITFPHSLDEQLPFEFIIVRYNGNISSYILLLSEKLLHNSFIFEAFYFHRIIFFHLNFLFQESDGHGWSLRGKFKMIKNNGKFSNIQWLKILNTFAFMIIFDIKSHLTSL